MRPEPRDKFLSSAHFEKIFASHITADTAADR